MPVVDSRQTWRGYALFRPGRELSFCHIKGGGLNMARQCLYSVSPVRRTIDMIIFTSELLACSASSLIGIRSLGWDRVEHVNLIALEMFKAEMV